MFISQVYIDTRKHETAKAMYNRNIMHGAIERCFEGERQHPLWRIDRISGMFSILIVSRNEPNFEDFVQKFGVSGIQPQTKSYDDFLEKVIQHDEIMRFHMTANPTIKRNGKRIPLNMKRTNTYGYCASDWLCDRLKKNGAELISGDISSFEKYKIKREKSIITMVAADFDGFIRITDKDKFVYALTNGIGHGKAYGCGMISVMRKN